MKVAIGLLVFFVAVFIALLAESAIPPVHAIRGARLVFVPLLFCYAAMRLPFPAMIGAAVYTGLLCDLMYLHAVGGQVEIALGSSIVFFVIAGCVAQGLQPSMVRGHWWPVIPLAAVVTSSYLLIQFIMITVRREGIVFDDAVVWRILAPGILAALFAPLVHLVVLPFEQFFPREAPSRLF